MHPDAAARPVGGLVLDERDYAADGAGVGAAGPLGCDGCAGGGLPAGTDFCAGVRGVSTSKVFAAQGLLVLDASGREFHRMGAPVLRAALERADELHAALVERNGELEAAGYHAQVAVGAQSSLLFLH